MFEFVIGFGLILAVITVVGFFFITKEKLKYRVKENLIDRKIHIKCPSCAGDIEDSIESEARKGKIEITIKHNCGATSVWDAHAWPPVLISKLSVQTHQSQSKKAAAARA